MAHLIGGMGLVQPGCAARNYAPLSGNEPELMTSEPVRMIQLMGELPQPITGEVWLDAICVVIGGQTAAVWHR